MASSAVRLGSGMSRRKPITPPKLPGHRPTVFVTFARTGDTPRKISVGNVMRLPPPAIEFTPPARRAAPKIRTCFQNDVTGSFEGGGALQPDLRRAVSRAAVRLTVDGGVSGINAGTNRGGLVGVARLGSAQAG